MVLASLAIALRRVILDKRLLALYVATSALTSPGTALRLLWVLLAKTPYFALRRLCSNLVPELFSKEVSEDTVLITGAASGIGRLLALRFAALGSEIVLIDINAELLAEARDEVANVLSSTGRSRARAHCFACDLADRSAATKTMSQVFQQVGTVTILVNNAGVVTGKKILEASEKAVDLTMRVNTHAHFWTIQAFLPGMLAANKGHIVSIASSAGLTGAPGLVDYCASKHGAVGTMESLRMELRKLKKSGVKTTTVCPYFIDTGMFDGLKSKWPRLLPILKPEPTVDLIMRAIRTDQELLLMPLAANLIFLSKLLPVPIQDEISQVCGIADVMDDFRGRPKTPTDQTKDKPFMQKTLKVMTRAMSWSG